MDPSQAAQYNAMEKATAAEVLKKQDDAAKSPASPKQKVGDPSAELSVRSEVIPVSSMTVHHAQSSPVVMHQSQHSTTLVSNAPNSPVANSPSAGSSASCHLMPAMPESAAAAATVTATTQQTQAPQSPQVNGSTMQSLFIEELHSASTRNRALSIEVHVVHVMAGRVSGAIGHLRTRQENSGLSFWTL